MKLLSSILLASASVMAVQRREDDSTVDHDAMNAVEEVHDEESLEFSTHFGVLIDLNRAML